MGTELTGKENKAHKETDSLRILGSNRNRIFIGCDKSPESPMKMYGYTQNIRIMRGICLTVQKKTKLRNETKASRFYH